MQELFHDVAARVALTIEIGTVLLIGVGAAGAFERDIAEFDHRPAEAKL